jgi:hypothetical protein
MPVVAGLVLASSLALTAVAAAETPLQEYQRSGRITPCKYSSGQLQGSVPNDIEQYAPEYKSQLDAAARDRARGCGGGASSSGSGPAGAGGGSGGTPGAGAPHKPPAPPKVASANGAPVGGALPAPAKLAHSDAATPAPIVALAILAAIGLLGAGLAGAGRYLGLGLDEFAPAGHALDEAGMRLGAAVTGATDWARAALSGRSS